jgi:hypothetical protein
MVVRHLQYLTIEVDGVSHIPKSDELSSLLASNDTTPKGNTKWQFKWYLK